MRRDRRRAAVIGGGIFGVSAALELSRTCDVTIIERGAGLFTGATYANHNRHHYGYHYPRSPETALQCLASRASFEGQYGDCLDWDFDNYYCVSKTDTKTTAAQYLAFCRETGLAYEEVYPPAGVLDRKKLALCLKVKEAVYDIAKLRAAVQRKLARNKKIKVLFGREVVGGAFDGDAKVLQVAADGRTEELAFDYVVNATYGSVNRFCGWFGFPRRERQFNLQELDVVELPLRRRIGVTVQDGPFPSIIPEANSRRYLMAHVNESMLAREISLRDVPLLRRVNYVESNWSRVLDVCAEYIPILRRATYVKSIFVDRVVDSARLHDDARLSEITAHGRGCWSIFSAKVITCVTTAEKLGRLVAEDS
jgi:glycine/D-amino acid oxidase-like deaminating enzyme